MTVPGSGPQPVGRFFGRVARWGNGGFGFIEIPDLDRHVYFNERALTGAPPGVNEEVDVEVVEFPGGKLVGWRVQRRLHEEASARGARPAVRAVIRGLASLVLPTASSPVGREPGREIRKDVGTDTLGGRGLADLAARIRGESQGRSQALRQQATALDQNVGTLPERRAAIEARTDERRHDLERQIAQLQREAEQEIAALAASADRNTQEAARLRADADAVDADTAEALVSACAKHIEAEQRRVADELARRETLLRSLTAERERSIRTGSEDAVRKYDSARQRMKSSSSAEDRDLFEAAARQFRTSVRSYADAAEAVDAWSPVTVPVWRTRSSAHSAIVVPLDASVLETEGVGRRVAAAIVEGIEEAGRDVVPGAATSIATVVGCFAFRVAEIDTELLVIALDEALDKRPSLTRFVLRFACEDVADLSLPLDFREDEVTDLDERLETVTEPPAGGTLWEVATRLGLELDELIAVLVRQGLPFPDDVLGRDAEESLRVLLGITTAEVTEAKASEEAAPQRAAPAAPEVAIAGRMLAKLLRAHVIGGKHTALQNVYGHHFADREKDMAKDIAERLVTMGILLVKSNVGQRHVSVNPRRLGDARALASGTCSDNAIIEALRR